MASSSSSSSGSPKAWGGDFDFSDLGPVQRASQGRFPGWSSEEDDNDFSSLRTEQDPSIEKGVNLIRERLFKMTPSEFEGCVYRASSQDRDVVESVLTRLDGAGDQALTGNDRLNIVRTLIVLAPSAEPVGTLGKVGAVFNAQIKRLITWFQGYKLSLPEHGLLGQQSGGTLKGMGKYIKGQLTQSPNAEGNGTDNANIGLQEAKAFINGDLKTSLQTGQPNGLVPYLEFQSSLAVLKSKLDKLGNAQDVKDVIKVLDDLARKFESIKPGTDPKGDAEKQIGVMITLLDKKIEANSKQQVIESGAAERARLSEMNKQRKIASYQNKIIVKTKEIEDLELANKDRKDFLDIVRRVVNMPVVTLQVLQMISKALEAKMKSTDLKCENLNSYQKLIDEQIAILGGSKSDVAGQVKSALTRYLGVCEGGDNNWVHSNAAQIEIEKAALQKYKAKLNALNTPVAAASSSTPSTPSSFWSTLTSPFSFAASSSSASRSAPVVGKIDIGIVEAQLQDLLDQTEELREMTTDSAERAQLIQGLEGMILEQRQALEVLKADQKSLHHIAGSLREMDKKPSASRDPQEVQKLLQRVDVELSNSAQERIYDATYFRMGLGEKLARTGSDQDSRRAIGKEVFSSVGSTAVKEKAKPLTFKQRADDLNDVAVIRQDIINDMEQAIAAAEELMRKPHSLPVEKKSEVTPVEEKTPSKKSRHGRRRKKKHSSKTSSRRSPSPAVTSSSSGAIVAPNSSSSSNNPPMADLLIFN